MKLMVIPVGRSLVFSGSQAKNISYSTDHRRKIFRTLPKRYFGLYLLVGGRKPYRLPITLASSLSPLNVPKTGFPWSIPPDLARLTPSALSCYQSEEANSLARRLPSRMRRSVAQVSMRMHRHLFRASKV